MLKNERLYQFKYDFESQKYVFCGVVVDSTEEKNEIEAAQPQEDYYEWYQLETKGNYTNTWKSWLRTLNTRVNPEEFFKCKNCGRVFIQRKILQRWYKDQNIDLPDCCPECCRNSVSDDRK